MNRYPVLLIGFSIISIKNLFKKCNLRKLKTKAQKEIISRGQKYRVIIIRDIVSSKNKCEIKR